MKVCLSSYPPANLFLCMLHAFSVHEPIFHETSIGILLPQISLFSLHKYIHSLPSLLQCGVVWLPQRFIMSCLTYHEPQWSEYHLVSPSCPGESHMFWCQLDFFATYLWHFFPCLFQKCWINLPPHPMYDFALFRFTYEAGTCWRQPHYGVDFYENTLHVRFWGESVWYWSGSLLLLDASLFPPTSHVLTLLDLDISP